MAAVPAVRLRLLFVIETSPDSTLSDSQIMTQAELSQKISEQSEEDQKVAEMFF